MIMYQFTTSEHNLVEDDILCNMKSGTVFKI